MVENILSFFSAGWLNVLGAVVIAYLLGSISFPIIITKIFSGGKDIRTMGSGNAGFTNVIRSVGKVAGILTIVLDFAKGVAATLIGGYLFSLVPVANVSPTEIASYGEYICGFIAIIGHMLPIFFNFKGGKGVVCAAALACVVDIRVFAIAIPVFLIVFLITKIISISSLIAAVSFAFATVFFSYFVDYQQSLQTLVPFTKAYYIVSSAFALAVCIFIFVKHKENIKRLKDGTEPKLVIKKKEK